MEEKDVSSFTSPSPHRLPTVSASEALQDLSSSLVLAVSTGLPHLDEVLQSRNSTPSIESSPRGLSRGEVTELYGPPGVGKTALAIQAAANVLNQDRSVVWIDTAQPLVSARLRKAVSCHVPLLDQEPPISPPVSRSFYDLLGNFHHFKTPTLPHLLALLCQPSLSFPPKGVSLIVVDSVSTLFATAFSRAIESYGRSQPNIHRNVAVRLAADRRHSVMSDFLASIGRLAAVKGIAILLISQSTTKVRQENGAVLRPALPMKAWDQGIHSRIVLFRDWPAQDELPSQRSQCKRIRFAGVVKVGGLSFDAISGAIPFVVAKHGIKELSRNFTSRTTTLPIILAPNHKRKHDEIADSQSDDEEVGSDEEFGWVGEDELDSNDLASDLPVGHAISTAPENSKP